MKKNIKVLCVFVLSFCLFMLPLNTTAASIHGIEETITIIDATKIIPNNGDAELQYVPCPAYSGKHAMESSGFGRLYSGPADGEHEIVFKIGCCYQCFYCHLVLVCQYEPDSGRLGYYSTVSSSEDISATGTYVYADPANIFYNSNLADDPMLAGFEFNF